MPNSLAYLCSPYTSPDPEVRESRFEAACRAAAELIRRGIRVFAPIPYTHGLCRYDLPLDWGFWQRFDLALLAMCDEVIVLKLDGWTQSVGVQAEIAAARTLGKPITLVLPSDLGVSDVLVPGRQDDVGAAGARRVGAVDQIESSTSLQGAGEAAQGSYAKDNWTSGHARTKEEIAMKNDARAIKALLTAHYADRAILERLFLAVAKTSPELRDAPLDFVTIGAEVAEAFGVVPQCEKTSRPPESATI